MFVCCGVLSWVGLGCLSCLLFCRWLRQVVQSCLVAFVRMLLSLGFCCCLCALDVRKVFDSTILEAHGSAVSVCALRLSFRRLSIVIYSGMTLVLLFACRCEVVLFSDSCV